MHSTEMSLQNNINYIMKNSIEVATNCQTIFMNNIMSFCKRTKSKIFTYLVRLNFSTKFETSFGIVIENIQNTVI